MRDIFGNPFRRVTLDLRWLTESAVALAAGIYAERAFDRMRDVGGRSRRISGSLVC